MKIDCGYTENFLKEFSRRLKNCKTISQYCNSGACYDCIMLFINNPGLGITEIQDWSDNHPQRIFLSDFLEKYPNGKLSSMGLPYELCPDRFGYEEKSDCFDGFGHCSKCWNQPLQ